MTAPMSCEESPHRPVQHGVFSLLEGSTSCGMLHVVQDDSQPPAEPVEVVLASDDSAASDACRHPRGLAAMDEVPWCEWMPSIGSNLRRQAPETNLNRGCGHSCDLRAER